MRKEDLQKAVADVRAQWEETIAELGPEGLERQGTNGDWSTRDVLAHCNGWDRWQLVQLRCAFSGETPTDDELLGGIDYPQAESMAEDAMNAMFMAGTRDLPQQAILDHWREISKMRADWVDYASQEQLEEVIGTDWGGGTMRVVRLASEVPNVSNPEAAWMRILDQVEHQRGHLKNVREWMKGSAGT